MSVGNIPNLFKRLTLKTRNIPELRGGRPVEVLLRRTGETTIHDELNERINLHSLKTIFENIKEEHVKIVNAEYQILSIVTGQQRPPSYNKLDYTNYETTIESVKALNEGDGFLTWIQNVSPQQEYGYRFDEKTQNFLFEMKKNIPKYAPIDNAIFEEMKKLNRGALRDFERIYRDPEVQSLYKGLSEDEPIDDEDEEWNEYDPDQVKDAEQEYFRTMKQFITLDPTQVADLYTQLELCHIYMRSVREYIENSLRYQNANRFVGKFLSVTSVVIATYNIMGIPFIRNFIVKIVKEIVGIQEPTTLIWVTDSIMNVLIRLVEGYVDADINNQIFTIITTALGLEA